MATLEGKTIVVVGGSSGIGFGVAKQSLLSGASHVIIGSSSEANIQSALQRLQAAVAGKGAVGQLTGHVVDAKQSSSVRAFIGAVGEIDHLVWTSGDPLRVGFPDMDLDSHRDLFDVRFWGAAVAAQSAKIRPGGSITLTIGQAVARPRPTWSLMTGLVGAVDSLTRGLAIDLAPTRVNVISPGLVRTELWDHTMSKEAQNKMFDAAAKTLPVKHVADADEIAEAYLFCMKCSYITGQRIEVDGGGKYT